MSSDNIFNNPKLKVSDFKFDKTVVDVFDNMAERSLPHYREIHSLCAGLCSKLYQEDTWIYDLGCSTASSILQIGESLTTQAKFHGIDNSDAMLEKARSRTDNCQKHIYEFSNQNLENPDIKFQESSIFLLLWTLQFLRPLKRPKLLEKIYQSLRPNGAVILFEKVLSGGAVSNRVFIDLNQEFKEKNGYTKTEIAKKRESLENVLVPYRCEENIELLEAVGFKEVECFFRWYNFAGFIAIK